MDTLSSTVSKKSFCEFMFSFSLITFIAKVDLFNSHLNHLIECFPSTPVQYLYRSQIVLHFIHSAKNTIPRCVLFQNYWWLLHQRSCSERPWSRNCWRLWSWHHWSCYNSHRRFVIHRCVPDERKLPGAKGEYKPLSVTTFSCCLNSGWEGRAVCDRRAMILISPAF